MLDDAVLKRMTLTAYEAATDPSRWHVLLEDLRSSFQATTASMFTPVVGANQRLLSAAAGMDAGAQTLIAQWVPHDPWLKARLEQDLPMGAGETCVGSEYLPWSQLERTEFFHECGRRVGVKGLVTLIVEGDQGRYGVPRTHLALSRDPSMPEFEAQHAEVLKALSKPFRAALQSYFALEQLQAVSTTIEDTYESIPNPLIVLDGNKAVTFANRHAAKMLREGLVVQAVQNRLTRVGNLCGDALVHILAAAQAGLGRPTPCWWLNDGEVRTGVLQVGKFSAGSTVTEAWADARLVVLLEIDDAKSRKVARLSALARRHQLTPSEIRVLLRLSEGLRPEAIARAESLGITTVRTHVAHMLQKTGAAGTFDLISLLVG